MIRPETLQHRVTDPDQEIRRPRRKDTPPAIEPDASTALIALRRRIAAAKALPVPRDVYDGAIWARGRDAAIAAIEAAEG